MKIIPFNATYVKVETNDWGEEQELADYFTYFADGYKYMPKYRAGIWDGKIRLFDQRSKRIYTGLAAEIEKFAKNRNHECINEVVNTEEVTYDDVVSFVKSLKLSARGKPIDARDYQLDAIYNMLSSKRILTLSPTSSGKSLLIYCYIMWRLKSNLNVTLVVPSTMLVEQMFNDFKDYSSINGFDVEKNTNLLYSGKERVFDVPIVITTWQSVAAMMKSDVSNFKKLTDRTDVLIGDEAHTYKASVVLTVMEKFSKANYRVGTTGTLDDKKINSLVLVGIFGPIYRVITTKQLMDSGQVTPLKIKSIVLEYPELIRKAYKGQDYANEINFLIGYKERNKFIARLAASTKGNTVVFFNFVDKHGAVLTEMIKEISDKEVYFIHGGVKTDEREEIRKLLDTKNNAVIVATSSLFSTGVNIPSIENLIFAVPSKSVIRILQSIGRGLRLKDGKTHCTLYDIADDLRYKKYINTSFNHLEDRVQIYMKEQFDITYTKLPLK